MKKIRAMSSCLNGQHEWMVNRWQTRGEQQNAMEYVCKWCLLAADKLEQKAQHDALTAQIQKPDSGT